MIGDAVEAAAMADRLLADGIYVRAFSFPVVPRGKARIRTQMSAAHTREDLDRAIAAFERARGADSAGSGAVDDLLAERHQRDRDQLEVRDAPSGCR